MKNLKAPILAVTLILFGTLFALAGPTPPPPTAKSASAQLNSADDDCVICPVDFPIDQNIVFLLIGGLILGGTVVYRNQTKKASN